jgi:glycosyltransferase involved in cell wall biosynthesis
LIDDEGHTDRLPNLIIQIPCFNEQASLPLTLGDLPRALPGVGSIRWLVIDDGSVDETAAVAWQHGADHVVRLPQNSGLANAFKVGLGECLKMGADIIVNTDADNQYCAADIPKLLRPILEGRADIVIGARPIKQIPHFSLGKRMLQRLGSLVVRIASGTDVNDAPSGFRAITREAALSLRIFSRYTYTLEMIIQAGQKGLRVVSTPIRVNANLRPSRLVKSVPSYVWRSLVTILRIFAIYRPFRFFAYVGLVPFLAGSALAARWLFLNIVEYPVTGRLHVPSLVVAAMLLIVSFQIWVLGFVADLLAANRRMLEEIALATRRTELRAYELHRELQPEPEAYRATVD